MKTKTTLLTTIAVLTMASSFSAQAVQVYDLKTDWSDTRNPNGTWEYLNAYGWPLSNDPFPWADSASGASLSRATAAEVVPGGLELGDIFVKVNNTYTDYGVIIRWTAPADGSIDLSGAAWNTYGPSWNLFLQWELTLNLLTPGVQRIGVGKTITSSRSEPADFSMGVFGPDVLLNIPVQAGDVLYLQLLPISFEFEPSAEQWGVEFSVTFTPDVLDPPEALQQLAQTVLAMNLQNGIANSLDTKLDEALNALDDVNENNDGSAVNRLEAFINAVEAQRGNKLTDAQADQLIAAAQAIQDQLVLP